MILLGAVVVFLGAFLLMWWAFGPRDELRIDDDHDYFPFWKDGK